MAHGQCTTFKHTCTVTTSQGRCCTMPGGTDHSKRQSVTVITQTLVTTVSHRSWPPPCAPAAPHKMFSTPPRQCWQSRAYPPGAYLNPPCCTLSCHCLLQGGAYRAGLLLHPWPVTPAPVATWYPLPREVCCTPVIITHPCSSMTCQHINRAPSRDGVLMPQRLRAAATPPQHPCWLLCLLWLLHWLAASFSLCC
jgi:hypothetical protein